MSATETRTYAVAGMTCNHCVASVTEEVSKAPGVLDVNVDLATGQLAVSGAGVTDEAIRTAVEEAGYALVT